MKKEKAITLISLVITIVVLIILAGVAIYLSLGNNGIFTRAKQAREATNKQTATEKINLKITTAQMNKYAEKQEMPTLKELSLVLKEDSEIQYVTEESQKVASAEYDVKSENPSSIFTKLNAYPYEFEINSSLQLASIDGVKIANEANNHNWKKYMMNENGYIIGNGKVELPTTYTELFIRVNLGGLSYNFNILYDELNGTNDIFIEGFCMSGYSNYARIDIKEKISLYLTEAYMNNNNVLSGTKVEIWYK